MIGADCAGVLGFNSRDAGTKIQVTNTVDAVCHHVELWCVIRYDPIAYHIDIDTIAIAIIINVSISYITSEFKKFAFGHEVLWEIRSPRGRAAAAGKPRGRCLSKSIIRPPME